MAHLNPKLTHLILELAHSNLRKRSRKSRRRRGKRKRRGGRKGRGREESGNTNGSNKKY